MGYSLARLDCCAIIFFLFASLSLMCDCNDHSCSKWAITKRTPYRSSYEFLTNWLWWTWNGNREPSTMANQLLRSRCKLNYYFWNYFREVKQILIFFSLFEFYWKVGADTVMECLNLKFVLMKSKPLTIYYSISQFK